MRTQRNALLAGMAALALVAGVGLASAQQSQDQNGAPPIKRPQASAQQVNKEAKGNAQKMGETANPTARKKHVAERSRMSHHHTAMREHNRRMGEERSRSSRFNTAARQPERTGLQGLQGNAMGGNVQLSDAQRSQIRNTVLNAPTAPRVGNVNFPVIAGTVIPRGSVQIMPVPPTLARIDPAWRRLRYFVWMDDLVIVNPRDMRIVAVVYV